MNIDISKELTENIEWIVSFNVGRFYKKGFRWKSKVRWSMTKLWNDPRFNNGYTLELRKTIGEERATRLFQDEIDKILSDPRLLEKASSDWRKDNPLADL